MKFLPHNVRRVSRINNYLGCINSPKSIYWHYGTRGPKIETDYNSGCYDVSKERVHQVHQKALGYSAKVDHLTCDLPYVEKPNAQGAHGAKIMTKRMPLMKDSVAERLLDNSYEGRYFYCRFAPDFLIGKQRVKNDFSMRFKSGVVIEEQEISAETMAAVYFFCDEFGIDFAELDILYDDLPYIIDVNNMAGAGGLFQKVDNPSLVQSLYINQLKSL